ncbi:elongation factor G [Sulfitobacter sp. D35]|uniref:elongation factor G n=1 Tax=Sulfitobacter sp. D35 TaxID=3083252 RepID=UPI00296F3DB4|nr:elongation factor G [Sulfitobacter sp. D35]MDW4497220.1 elongation factor G [Sulfitobacter sp. D35]
MRAFAVIGPSQSGKTTLVEGLAGLETPHAQGFSLMGDVSVKTFAYMGDDWTVLDVPGGHDTFAMVGPALAVCDAAVLCVPAEADAAVLAAPYLRTLEESGIPTFLFVNRIDAATDRVADIVAALQTYCKHGIVLRQIPMRLGDRITGAIDLISERAWEYHEGERSSLVELPRDMQARETEARSDLLETLADFDDTLLEQIIEDQVPASDSLYTVATRVLQHHDLIPALLGAASQGNGLQRLMKSLRHEVPDVATLRDRLDLPDGVLAATSLADHLKHIGKAVLMRALGPGVAPGCRLGGAAIGSLNALDGKSPVSTLPAGHFALTIKSDHMAPGKLYEAEAATDLPDWAQAHPPALRRLTRPVHEKDENKLSAALGMLAEIDPGLSLAQDEATGMLEVGVQGPLHLRRMTAKLSDAYGIEVDCIEVPAALRETIRRGAEKRYRHRKQSGGAGQFADVVIDLTPRASGSGFEFSETVKGGAVPRNYIPAVEAGARDALASGPAGFPVVDVAVTLKDGKAHSVDSSDLAFRIAGQSAVREALSEIGTVVLQPILNVDVEVPSVFSGGLVQLVSGLKGRVLGFEAHPVANGWDVFHAQLPMASLEDLSMSLGGATRGTAWFHSTPDHYEETRERLAASA